MILESRVPTAQFAINQYVPELPEVETVRLTLTPILNSTVTKVGGSGKTLRQKPVKIRAMKNHFVGQKISKIRRRGKYLTLHIGTSYAVVHLGMSGRLRIQDVRTELDQHCHVWFLVSKGRQEKRLVFRAPRRFGQFEFFKAQEVCPALEKLGPDPLLDGVSLGDSLKNRKAKIKTVLLDQKVLAGVGNIYASEALWRAKILPETPACDLQPSQVRALNKAVARSLEVALDKGGTSLKDFVAADGQEGGNAPYLKVYGRQGDSCPRAACRGTIHSAPVAGRSTYWCNRCQI